MNVIPQLVMVTIENLWTHFVQLHPKQRQANSDPSFINAKVYVQALDTIGDCVCLVILLSIVFRSSSRG